MCCIYVGVLNAGYKRYLILAENVNIGVWTRASVEQMCVCVVCAREEYNQCKQMKNTCSTLIAQFDWRIHDWHSVVYQSIVYAESHTDNIFEL